MIFLDTKSQADPVDKTTATMATCRRILASVLTALSLLWLVAFRTASKALPPPRDVFPTHVVKFGTTGSMTLDGLAGESRDRRASTKVMSIMQTSSSHSQGITSMAMVARPEPR